MLKEGVFVVTSCEPSKKKSYMNGYIFRISGSNSFYHHKKQSKAYFLEWSKEHNQFKQPPLSPGSLMQTEIKRIEQMKCFFWFENELMFVPIPPRNTSELQELPLF